MALAWLRSLLGAAYQETGHDARALRLAHRSDRRLRPDVVQARPGGRVDAQQRAVAGVIRVHRRGLGNRDRPGRQGDLLVNLADADLPAAVVAVPARQDRKSVV